MFTSESVALFNKKTKTAPIEKIKERLFQIHGTKIKIVEKTYKKAKAKALFVDEEFGEFWAEPTYVITRKRRHPAYSRSKNRLTEKELQDRLDALYGGSVKIDYSTFVCTHKKCLFHIKSEFGLVSVWKNCKAMLQGGQNLKRNSRKRQGANSRAAKKRREQIKKATPKWLTPLQKEAIAAIYEMARLKSATHAETYHVDHIVPILGKEVCGLHVPWNLEVITSKHNLRNNNKLLWWRIGMRPPSLFDNKKSEADYE